MEWNIRDDLPIYAQLIYQMKSAIASGRLLPGDRLASVRDMALEARVNPNTMQRAMAELERLGLVFSQRTAGRFVTEDEAKVNRLREHLAQQQVREFLQGMARLGFQPEEILPLIEKERKELV